MEKRDWISISLATILIVIFVYIMFKQIKENHLQDDPMLHYIKQTLLPLHPVVKDIKLYKGDKSYTINKEKIFLCLKDKQDNYYPLNQLILVCIHEIAHKINDQDVGHTPAFHKIFDELLLKASTLGIYNPSIPHVQNYCE